MASLDAISAELLVKAMDWLTEAQSAKLDLIVQNMDDDGQFDIEKTARAMYPDTDTSVALANFRQFRSELHRAVDGKAIRFQVVADRRNSSTGTIVGDDYAGRRFEELSKNTTRSEFDKVKTVEQSATELGARIRIHIECLSPDAQHRSLREYVLADDFVDLLQERLALRGLEALITTSEITVGEHKAKIDNARTAADAVLWLLGPQFVRTRKKGEQPIPGATSGRDVRVRFAEMKAEYHDLIPFGPAFLERRTPEARAEFVDELLPVIEFLHRRLTEPAIAELDELALDVDAQSEVDRLNIATLARRAGDETLIDDVHGEEMTDSKLDAGSPGRTVVALDRLKQWATDRSETAQKTCVLLGDTGMGKTTTARRIVTILLGLRKEGESGAWPLPIYFDLRELGPTQLEPVPSVRDLLQLLLKASAGTGAPLDAEALLSIIRTQECIIVFDGLDEVLVHLDKASGQKLTRRLVEVIDADSSSKLLLTCRTHYFRTVRDEINHFHGEEREDRNTARGYLALVMRPFNSFQVRSYVEKNVAPEKREPFLHLLSRTHNLAELSTHPYLLSVLAKSNFVRKGDGEVNAADVYTHITQSWLERDTGKHALKAVHKLELMEHFAAEEWVSRSSIDIGAAEDWVHSTLEARSDFRRLYGATAPEVIEEDFRTATFLIRNADSSYTFAHSSLREYFIAQGLLRGLLMGGDELHARWSLPTPSIEIFDFLGQLLSGGRPEQRAAALASLEEVRASYSRGVSEAVFAYGLRAAAMGHPGHSLTHSDLRGAMLDEVVVIGTVSRPIDLTGSDFTSASLRRGRLTDAILENVKFTSADLTAAEIGGDSTLIELTVRGATFDDATLFGAVLHDLSLISQMDGARLYRTQFLRCVVDPGAPVLDDPEAMFAGCRNPDGTLIPPPSRGDSLLRLTSMTGHAGWVQAASIDASGVYVLTSSDDGTARLWDKATGELLQTHAAYTGRVRGAGFSLSGSTFVTGSDDGIVRARHTRTGEEVWEVDLGPQPVYSVRHADSRLIATVNGAFSVIHDGSARTFASNELEGTISDAALEPNGSRAVIVGERIQAQIWELSDATRRFTFGFHTGAVRCCDFAPDGSRVVTADSDGVAWIWRPEAPNVRSGLFGHYGAINSVRFSPDGSRIVTAGADGTVRLWNATTVEHLLTIVAHGRGVMHAEFNSDSTEIVTAGMDGSARVWDAATGTKRQSMVGSSGVLWSARVNLSGDRLVTTSRAGTARTWSMDGTPVDVIGGHEGRVLAADFLPGGSLVTSGEDGRVRVHARTGEVIELIRASGPVRSVSVAVANEKSTVARIATANDDGTAQLWELETGQFLRTLEGHEGRVRSVRFNRSGLRLVTGSSDRTAIVWSSTTGMPLWVLEGHTGRVRSAVFDRSGDLVATASGDHEARVWRGADPEHTFTGHHDGIMSVEFSPSGDTLLTGSAAGDARLWDVRSEQCLAQLRHAGGWVRSAVFVPDGKRIVTGGSDGTVRIWQRTGNEVAVERAIELFPDGGYAVWDGDRESLIAGSPEAWRWLGWSGFSSDRATVLPGESFGLLQLQPEPSS